METTHQLGPSQHIRSHLPYLERFYFGENVGIIDRGVVLGAGDL